MTEDERVQLAVHTIRRLLIHAVQAARSGHPRPVKILSDASELPPKRNGATLAFSYVVALSSVEMMEAFGVSPVEGMKAGAVASDLRGVAEVACGAAPLAPRDDAVNPRVILRKRSASELDLPVFDFAKLFPATRSSASEPFTIRRRERASRRACSAIFSRPAGFCPSGEGAPRDRAGLEVRLRAVCRRCGTRHRDETFGTSAPLKELQKDSGSSLSGAWPREGASRQE